MAWLSAEADALLDRADKAIAVSLCRNGRVCEQAAKDWLRDFPAKKEATDRHQHL
ncbi:hypothetical protein Q2941_33185 [Bradyrhizobium sp. UFLA05-153]